ncbi:MAG: alpha/beta hydrolase fold domain-containing protein [Acidimicrobiia bacterium]
MPWIFLTVSAVGLWFTVNALWPSHRTEFVGPSFFAGWLTGELAGFHIAWQAVATGVFIALGALDAWPGYVGLALTAVSWTGLVWMIAIAHRSGAVVEAALCTGLGDGYRDEIAPGRAERLASSLSRRRLLLPFNLRDRRVERTRNIRYADGAGRRHLLDVYTPREGVERAPVLLQIHGGGWIIGDKSQQGLPLMLHLAAEGWVCVANNYRLSPKATFPDHLVDCKLALAWVREHITEYGGDPDFIVVTGGSAGGHLSALVALTANQPEYQPGFEHVDTSVVAAVPFYGVYDLIDTFHTPDGKPVDAWLAKRFLKTTIAEDRALYESGSPLHCVGADAPPFFVVHGDQDNLVPVRQARAFVDALRALSGQPVAYAEIAGGSHAFDVFHSIRTGNAVNGVDRFLAWVYSAYSAALLEQGVDPPDPAIEADDQPAVSSDAASVEVVAGGG